MLNEDFKPKMIIIWMLGSVLCVILCKEPEFCMSLFYELWRAYISNCLTVVRSETIAWIQIWPLLPEIIQEREVQPSAHCMCIRRRGPLLVSLVVARCSSWIKLSNSIRVFLPMDYGRIALPYPFWNSNIALVALSKETLAETMWGIFHRNSYMLSTCYRIHGIIDEVRNSIFCWTLTWQWTPLPTPTELVLWSRKYSWEEIPQNLEVATKALPVPLNGSWVQHNAGWLMRLYGIIVGQSLSLGTQEKGN